MIVQAVTGEFDLQWNASPDPSVVSYNVYTGTDPNFVPNSGNQIASGVIQNAYSHYFDADPSVTWYYKVTAVNSSSIESIPSASSNGAVNPESTSTSYTDAPNSSIPPDDSYYIDADGNPVNPNAPAVVRADVTPAAATNVLVSFYGAGQIPFGGFGNVHLAAISAKLGGTLNSTKDENGVGVPYLDWHADSALHDLLANLDANGDKVVTPAEIAAKNISVIGYSLGAVEAANFTRMLAAPNPNAGGFLHNVVDAQHPHGHNVYSGGWNLEAAVPIKNLVTIDPVLHAVFGLSRLLRTTDGPLANVINFTNYYETRGGTATAQQYLDANGQISLGADDYTIGNFFSASIHGDMLGDHSQNAKPDNQINVNSTFANASFIIPYRNSEGSVIFAKFKGSQVQHDVMPFFVEDIFINLITNS